jgi:PhnB protein
MPAHLHFQGNCSEAFSFYADTFGGKIEMAMTYGEAPSAEHTPAEFRDRIIHARVNLNDQVIMGCDAPPERYQKPQGFNVIAQVKNASEAQRIFNTLARDGQVVMPFQETFWAHGFGMCTDRYGIPWMINCEKPLDTLTGARGNA